MGKWTVVAYSQQQKITRNEKFIFIGKVTLSGYKLILSQQELSKLHKGIFCIKEFNSGEFLGNIEK